jgi:hypothetical protein
MVTASRGFGRFGLSQSGSGRGGFWGLSGFEQEGREETEVMGIFQRIHGRQLILNQWDGVIETALDRRRTALHLSYNITIFCVFDPKRR